MTTAQELIVYPDHDTLAAAIAARALTVIKDAQAARGIAQVSLTGGRGGTSALAAILASPAINAVDWSKIDFWWSDERFLNKGDLDRNDTGAFDVLLDHVPVDPARVHPMPYLNGPLGHDVDAAAAFYAAELARAAGGTPGSIPTFDISMLGIGEDAHVASLFPGRQEQFKPATVVSVRDSPKPPPTRTTFTMNTILASLQVWLIASGSGKADAIKLALGGLPALRAPAGAVRGLERTLVLCDQDAAAQVVAGS